MPPSPRVAASPAASARSARLPGPTAGVPLQLPRNERGPFLAIARRIGIAVAMLVALVVLVVVDRGGYTDTADGQVSVLDAVYYATVSISTTGYGDVTPVSTSARLTNIVLVTPLRIGFLVILVGTTLEVLTERTRVALAQRRWRGSVCDQVVVCGYGTKGRAAVRALQEKGTPPDRIIVVDPDPQVIAEANSAGLTGVVGSATRSDVLRTALITRATTVVVAPKNDEQAVLITLTARELAPEAVIVAAVRETENAHLLTRSGADSVITSSDAAGRLLGLATSSPLLVGVVEDLLAPGSGLDLLERAVTDDEIGRRPGDLGQPVLAIVRDGQLLRFDTAEVGTVQAGDRVVCVESARTPDRRPSLD